MTRTVSELTDEALMLEVQTGGRVALGELYDRLADRAYRTAFAVCHDRDCAQDAVQDAFVAMWSSKATYEPARGPVAAWAMSIVRHRAIYLSRRRALAMRLAEETELEHRSAVEDVLSDVHTRDALARVMEVLSKLPSAQQEVIRLGFFDGFSHGEIARRLALPPGTVKGRMRLGLTKLRLELDAELTRSATTGSPHTPVPTCEEPSAAATSAVDSPAHRTR